LLGLSVNDTNDYGTDSLTTISAVNYDSLTNRSTLELTGVTGELLNIAAVDVFLTITRLGSQAVFPDAFVKDSNGFFYADFVFSSRAPLEELRVKEGTQVGITGYRSLGYELVVNNLSYSYSMAEDTALQVTPTVLANSAVSFEDAYITARSEIEISYDRSQLVDDVQAFALTDFSRVVCNNPLVRHYFPAYLYMTLSFRGSRSSQQIKDGILSFVSRLSPNRVLSSFELENVLGKLGVSEIEHPISLAYLLYGEDRKPSIIRLDSELSLSERSHIMDDDSKILTPKI
jgi:hypothetical protein